MMALLDGGKRFTLFANCFVSTQFRHWTDDDRTDRNEITISHSADAW